LFPHRGCLAVEGEGFVATIRSQQVHGSASQPLALHKMAFSGGTFCAAGTSAQKVITSIGDRYGTSIWRDAPGRCRSVSLRP
jgi:hypothetical protein